MTLDQLKVRLNIPLDDHSQDEYLQAQLDDAIALIQSIAGQSFENEEKVVVLPTATYSIVTDIVKYQLAEQGLVKSESIGGMSQTFVTYDEFLSFINNKLSQLGLRRVRFIPFKKRGCC